jgi:hypothetical protein
MHVGGVQRVPVLEVAVYRRPGTPCGPRDFVHPDGGGVLLGEQVLCRIEDPVGGHLGAPLGQPVAH